MWKWTRWRDLRFKDEVKLYEWHIDFWMENGTTYWQDWVRATTRFLADNTIRFFANLNPMKSKGLRTQRPMAISLA